MIVSISRPSQQQVIGGNPQGYPKELSKFKPCPEITKAKSQGQSESKPKTGNGNPKETSNTHSGSIRQRLYTGKRKSQYIQ